jgi:hypothetical protein
MCPLSHVLRGPGSLSRAAGLCGGALVVEGEEVAEYLLSGEVGGPAVGAEDGIVEGAVGVFQPGAFSCGAEVVELGEGSVLEVGFRDGRFAGGGRYRAGSSVRFSGRAGR